MLRYLIGCLLLTGGLLSAQDSYQIDVTIDGYDGEFIVLANYLMDKQYVVDTAYLDGGKYTFASDTNDLNPGVYAVVLPPDNDIFQVLIPSQTEQTFSLATQKDALGRVRATGSPDNALFYDYLAYLDDRGTESAPFREQLADSTLAETQRTDLEAKMSAINDRVREYQQKVLADAPETLTALIIRANQSNDPPTYDELEGDAKVAAQLTWLREHYFDHIDLTDDRLLRTPFLNNRVKYYIEKLHVPHPDTLTQVLDGLLAKMDPESELYKYYLVNFVNEAARSQVIGQDAIYVHLIDKYYARGKAGWTDDEQRQKMIDNANKIRPTLIGKKAPDIVGKTKDGDIKRLYDVDAEHTILYFWRYDCSHCKKSSPVMDAFHEKWKERGVALYAVCVKTAKDLPACWDYVEEKNLDSWIHVGDEYMRYYKNYDIRSTPYMFILDEDKNIIMKRLSAEQLDEWFTDYLEAREQSRK